MSFQSAIRQQACSKNLFAALILFSVLFIYWPAADSQFIWDDNAHIVTNQNMNSVQGLGDIWLQKTEPGEFHHYPITASSHWVEYQLWSLKPFFYRLVNLCLHLINIGLFAYLLRCLKIPGLLFAILLFATHPLFTESVSWISGRNNLLCTAFVLLSWLMFMRKNIGFYMISLGFFALAMLAKPIACILPIMIVGSHLIAPHRSQIKALFVRLLPMLAIGFVTGVYFLQQESALVGTLSNKSLIEQFLIMGRIFCFHIGKFLYPINLSFLYPKWPDVGSIWSLIAACIVVVMTFIIFRVRSMHGRGIALGIFWYSINIIPVSGLLPLNYFRFAYVSDHFAYLPGMGLCIAAGCLLHGVRGHIKPYLFYPLFLIMLGVMLMTAQLRTQILQYPESAFRDTLKKNSNSWMAHSELATTLADQGKTDEAKLHLFRTIQIEAGYNKAYIKLGNIYFSEGDDENALSWYLKALMRDPKNIEARFNISTLHLKVGKTVKARQVLESILLIDSAHEPTLKRLRGLNLQK
ncbi:MAG: hypothetical protein ACI9CF_001621 [Candidatus Omnitrophota bacterium]|jgi:hypothetical protein